MYINPLTRISQKTGSRFVKTHGLYKTALVREALALQDYTYYHYTHRKIPVLSVRGDLPSSQTLETRKSFSFLTFSVFLTALGHKNGHNFAALYRTIFF